MTAREMFNELGFEILKEKDDRILYIHKAYFEWITFYKDSQIYLAEHKGHIGTSFHQAIHQQMKELGWLHE